MKVLVQFYDKNGRELLGSDGAAIFSDLKTLKGVHRRLSHWSLRPSADFHCWGARSCEGSVHRDELARRG